MNHKKTIIKELCRLGDFIGQFKNVTNLKPIKTKKNDIYYESFLNQLKIAKESNGWFTTENLCFALNQWSKLLKYKPLESWLSKYSIPNKKPKTVAIIMAGNIPLVGFHDFLSAFVTGHNMIIKQSSNDKHLLPILVSFLMQYDKNLKSRIKFVDEKLHDFDAVIATGSNNTANYFESYFKNKPSIIRKNRNSIAIINGSESKKDLEGLGIDIFQYFGLGCRSVSKIYVPRNYDFDKFFNAIYSWHPIINNTKYANNYDYNKAVYIMSKFKIIENGFLMLKEDKRLSSPIGTLFYEYYDNLDELKNIIENISAEIQCLVSYNFDENEIKFGNTQLPNLLHYADDIDTVDFLLKI